MEGKQERERLRDARRQNVALGRVLACLKGRSRGCAAQRGRLREVTVADTERPVFQVQRLCRCEGELTSDGPHAQIVTALRTSARTGY